MIVFKKSDNPAFGGKEYSHIECDVPGCGRVSPTADDLARLSLFARGWFIVSGMHRCPEHFTADTQANGPIIREADGSEGFVR